MNNKQAKYYLKKLPEVKKRLAENKAKLKRLQKSIGKDESIVRKLDYYWKDAPEIEIYNGVVLIIYDSEESGAYTVEAIDENNSRHADIYLNAHNNRTFGCHLKVYTGGKGNGEAWLGADWESRDELIKIGKDFVAKAIIPDKVEKDNWYRDFRKKVAKYKEI